MPTGGNVDMGQLAKLFVSHAVVADLEKRVSDCENKDAE